MAGVTVPEEYEEWPFEARRFVLAEANDTVALRRKIEEIVGLPHEDVEDNAGQFTKDELAAVLMALGGPEDR
jgi:hypothetical protein